MENGQKRKKNNTMLYILCKTYSSKRTGNLGLKSVGSLLGVHELLVKEIC